MNNEDKNKEQNKNEKWEKARLMNGKGEDKDAEQRTHNSKTVTMIGQHGAAKYDD